MAPAFGLKFGQHCLVGAVGLAMCVPQALELGCQDAMALLVQLGLLHLCVQRLALQGTQNMNQPRTQWLWEI